MKRIFNFRVKLQSDTGLFILDVCAYTIADAVETIMESENCPESAIKSIVRYKELTK